MLLFTPLGGIFDYVGNVFAQQVVDPTGYPYKSQPDCQNDGTGCVNDDWGFYRGECTSYVAWKINNDRGTGSAPYFFFNSQYGAGDAQRFSHGGHWDNALQDALNNISTTNTAYLLDHIPAIGAVAVWNTTPGNAYGHVAYVEAVRSNGNIDVSEYNFSTVSRYGTRSDIAPADHYIHFNAAVTTNAAGVGGRIMIGSNISTKETLVTLRTFNNNFYSQRTTNGTYYFPKVPAGIATLQANDGTNKVSLGNVNLHANFTKSYDLQLNNQCVQAPTALQSDPRPSGSRFSLIAPVSAQSTCSIVPFIPATGNPPGGGGTPPACTTAPSSYANVTGATQGNNGWWRSSTQVSFYASAPCGPDGLSTKYSINGGSLQTYSGPFTINQEGIHNITYYSVDGLGNTESTKSVQVKIDWTPPVTSGNATGPRDTNGIFRDNVTAGLTSTDNLSGVESQQRSMDGGTNWITMNGSNNTFQITGNGVSRFVFRATDIAGNLELFKDSGPIIINKYVIYSNGTASSLRFTNTTGVNITGDIYSGGTTTFDGNTGGIFGTTFKTVGTSNLIKNTNTNIQVPSIVTGVSSVPMLSYPLSLYKSLATVVFPSDLYLDSVSSQLKGILYVEGNVKMVDVGLSGPVSIVATGSINDVTTDSTFQTGDPNNGVLLYAGTNIEVNSTGNRNLGLMYAPNGVVKIRATGLTLKGSLVGKEVELYGATNFNLSYNAAFASSTHALPLVAMGLNIPTTVAPAVPSVPALSKPANSATGISNTRPKISWSSSTGAVGYNLQVSTSSTFSTLTYNGSVLSTGVSSMNLSKGTKYYWRVRSINQGGMSVWSAVRYFTTQN